ncbi:MAG: hypothetical protein NC832_01435, partial [Candidatus Omnitrophica bacterium]|nr:hypothetical protein [Candidatus Omnitrophota bacterium]
VEKAPSGELSLAIERPSLYNIFVNGHKISNDMVSGWWVDKSLETIKFNPSILKIGKNEILLETDYDEEHPGLEIIYLLGNFSVKLEGKEISISESKNYLKIGDWTEQGLPFYSGCVSYIHPMKYKIKENQRMFVRVSKYMGAGIRIFVDEREAGIIAWPPDQLDITDYIKGKDEFVLKIEVLGHRRNSHGPFHFPEKWPLWTGPTQFFFEGKEWFDGYQLVPSGLMEYPEIVIYEVMED